MAASDMEQFGEAFSQCITKALLDAPFTNLYGPLYHFTNEAGLHGILRSRSLWASLAMALTDQGELRYALTRATQLIKSARFLGDAAFLLDVVPHLDTNASRTVEILGLKTYVTSFRTNTDARDHWNTYGMKGTGFALAFNPKSLVIPGTLLLPVLYEPDEQDKLLREFIESGENLFRQLSAQCPAEMMPRLRECALHWIALGVWTLAPLIKEYAFRNEGEWRLIVIEPKHVVVNFGPGISTAVHSRSSEIGDIPYKVIEYGALPIVGIELGAHALPAVTDPVVAQLLSSATGGSVVPITRSQLFVDS